MGVDDKVMQDPQPWVSGPATQAAKRAKAGPGPAPTRARAYPLPVNHEDANGDAVVLAATRALVSVQTRADASHVLRTAVSDLGGAVIPARLADDRAIPVDVSLGDGEPQVVVADPLSMASLRLSHHLPMLLQDALLVAARCDHSERQARRASVDVVTGVATRAEIGPRLGRAGRGDVVCLLDLDGFKKLNDTYGHARGDEALGAFGALLRSSVRENDFCGRLGGDEFIVVMEGVSIGVGLHRMQALCSRWSQHSPDGISASAGVAAVDHRGAPAAVKAADKALYRAKRFGRDRVEVAGLDDYDGEAQATTS